MSKSRPSTATSTTTTTRVFVDPSVRRFKQPIERLMNSYPNCAFKITIAITASPSQDPTCGKLLVLHRRKRGLRLFDPRKPRRGEYQLPGGDVQPEDASVIMAVLRQVYGDTGLKVLGVLGTFDLNGEEEEDRCDALSHSTSMPALPTRSPLSSPSWTHRPTPPPSLSAASSESSSSSSRSEDVKSLNFIVEVERGVKAEIQVDPKKYDSYQWIDVKSGPQRRKSSSRLSLRRLSSSKPYDPLIVSAIQALEEYY